LNNEFNTPWVAHRLCGIRYSIVDSERSTVTDRIDPNRASHIVRAVNSHDALVGALGSCVSELRAWMRDHGQDIKTQEAINEAKAALAKATEAA